VAEIVLATEVVFVRVVPGLKAPEPSMLGYHPGDA
jgi:hypothetical protein